ncbi:MAG: flippase-like domain-containing protein [Chloroflexi bacterium]|nr:flippase-like domain-containing protein [Chloroflexota bacterium]
MRIPVFLKAAASMLLLAFVLLKVDTSTLARELTTSNMLIVACGAALAFAANFLAAYKWQYLLAQLGANVRYKKLLHLLYTGMFYNTVLPGQVGGEVVKGVGLARSGVTGTTSALSVLIDRLLGLLALFALGIVGLLLSRVPEAVGTPLMSWFIVLSLILVVVVIVLVTGRGIGPLSLSDRASWLPGRHHFAAFGRLLVSYWEPRHTTMRAVLVPFLLSLTFQLTVIATNLLVSLGLGIRVTFTDLLWIVAVVSLLQSLPISIAGLGVREGAYVYLMQLQGVAAPAALALSLTIFASQVLMASVGGLLQLQSLLKRKSMPLPVVAHTDVEVTSHEPC